MNAKEFLIAAQSLSPTDVENKDIRLTQETLVTIGDEVNPQYIAGDFISKEDAEFTLFVYKFWKDIHRIIKISYEHAIRITQEQEKVKSVLKQLGQKECFELGCDMLGHSPECEKLKELIKEVS